MASDRATNVNRLLDPRWASAGDDEWRLRDAEGREWVGADNPADANLAERLFLDRDVAVVVHRDHRLS